MSFLRPFFKIAKKRRTIDAKNKISKRCIYPHDVLSDGLCHDLLQHFHEHRRNDKSGLSDGVSRDDNHVAGRFYPRVFPRGSSGSQISFLHGNTAGSSDRNHAGNFHYDYCYYVSDYEFYCNAAV